MKITNKNTFIMTHKVFIIALSLLCSTIAFGQKQIEVTKLKASELPAGIKYEGKIKDAVRWTDKLGDNIVITSITGHYRSKKFKHESESSSDAELFAYHFIVKNDSVVKTWKVYDFVDDCVCHLILSYIKNTFQVTDLDGNGIAEIWLMYQHACIGDVSPLGMKIIMYEGMQKYAMRGINKAPVGKDENDKIIYEGGEYKYDKAFANGPKEFLQFAKELWKKNIMQRNIE